jgi:hypothetical protein
MPRLGRKMRQPIAPFAEPRCEMHVLMLNDEAKGVRWGAILFMGLQE